jgi:REP element-mobilizing transposase RayT
MTLFRNKYRIESTRLRGWDYSREGLYFVTICTHNRVHCFGEVIAGEMVLSPIGKIVAEEWQKTPLIRPNVELDAWILMPNHSHGIVMIMHQMQISEPPVETPRRGVSTTNPDAPIARLQPNSLGAIIGQFKSVCTKRIWAAGFRDFAWQPRFYDSIIRNERSLVRIREYIINNPRRWEQDRNNLAGIYM